MKRLLLGVIALLVVSQPLCVYAGDGKVFAAGVKSSDSNRAIRAEQEAVRKQEKATQIQIEQDRQRIVQLEREIDRRDTERQLQEARAAQVSKSANPVILTLMILVGLLTFVVIGLAIIVLRRRQ